VCLSFGIALDGQVFIRGFLLFFSFVHTGLFWCPDFCLAHKLARLQSVGDGKRNQHRASFRWVFEFCLVLYLHTWMG